MARKITWAPSALNDLRAISDYISRDSRSYAACVIEKILGSAERLLDFPRIGRVVPEFDQDDIRELIVYSYRVIYQVQGDDISVASVVHGARRLKAAMRGSGLLRRRRKRGNK